MLIFIYIFAFLVTISVLVVFHEYGHFWVARRFGVRVLRFSVGFGKPLYRRQGRDGVEYVIAAIPLGGYVQMLDEKDVAVSLSEQEAQTAFNRQSLLARATIVAAGPAFNFILAFILYVLMFMVGTTVTRPLVDTVLPNSVAEQAGLLAGDEITAVGRQTVNGWQQTLLAMVGRSMDAEHVAITVKRNNDERHVLNFFLGDKNLLEDEQILEKLGIRPMLHNPPAVVAEVLPGSAAQQATVRRGDRIVALGQQSIDGWRSLTKAVSAQAGVDTSIAVDRGGSFLSLPIRIDTKTDRQGRPVGHIGVRVQIDEAALNRNRVFVQYELWDSIRLGLARTWDMTSLTVGFIWQLIGGQASIKHIGGPITIAEYAGTSFLIGLGSFLGAMALLSISIGLINLLPIPVLDGGHLLFYLIELFKGSPPSQLFQAVANRLGLLMLGGLMFLALFNDLNRLLQ